MGNELREVLEGCWRSEGATEDTAVEAICRWCERMRRQGHEPGCPCTALDLALQQRDALAAYIKAEKRSAVMQGALRLAKKSAKVEVKQRVDESALQLEATLARLRELGIEEMVR